MSVRASTPGENTMPTLAAFDAEFGSERAWHRRALARFLPLVGLVLAAVGISAALLWGSVDRQVWRLWASRAVAIGAITLLGGAAAGTVVGT